jgi:hypothetical protein
LHKTTVAKRKAICFVIPSVETMHRIAGYPRAFKINVKNGKRPLAQCKEVKEVSEDDDDVKNRFLKRRELVDLEERIERIEERLERRG